ncbi:CC_3452 family protein [Phenylobacterium montanum]|uniref:Uncharacterized protein n=1 Tax=Phenylobacterium montanum TaxID=2823693 RepID=A0A975FXX8_9CAUL|nr:hypothetical protein [Caulobacter sp. S6]QUD86862.1 hypothetical protein KCG34_17535 [Caulobacter sp. S6]
MIVRTLALVAAFSALAGSALADGRAEATLQKPVASPVKAIIGDASWSCLGTVCAAFPATEAVQSISVCKQLVKAAGPVASYSFDGKAFPPDLLARCNGTK